MSEPYAEEVMFDISNVGEGLVVIGDSFDEGWRATVDGISTPIYRAGDFAGSHGAPRWKTLITTMNPQVGYGVSDQPICHHCRPNGLGSH